MAARTVAQQSNASLRFMESSLLQKACLILESIIKVFVLIILLIETDCQRKGEGAGAARHRVTGSLQMFTPEVLRRYYTKLRSVHQRDKGLIGIKQA